MRTARSSGVWVMRLMLGVCCAAILCGHGLYSMRHSHVVSPPKDTAPSRSASRRQTHSHSHGHKHSHSHGRSHSHRRSHSHHSHSHAHSHGHSHSHGDDDGHDHSHDEGSHVHVWLFGWEFVLWTGEPDRASPDDQSLAGSRGPLVLSGNGDARYLVIVPWLLLPVSRPIPKGELRESGGSQLSERSRRLCDPPDVPPPRVV